MSAKQNAEELKSLHARTFKLRFAETREPGRSCVSAVKPMALPATVTGKCGRLERAGGESGEGGESGASDEARALGRVADMFRLGPRERHRAPVLSSQEYGWWCDRGGRWQESHWLHHHIRDSPWLKASLRMLNSDATFRR